MCVYLSKKEQSISIYLFCTIISVQMGSFQHISRYKSGCLYIQIDMVRFPLGVCHGPSYPILSPGQINYA